MGWRICQKSGISSCRAEIAAVVHAGSPGLWYWSIHYNYFISDIAGWRNFLKTQSHKNKCRNLTYDLVLTVAVSVRLVENDVIPKTLLFFRVSGNTFPVKRIFEQV